MCHHKSEEFKAMMMASILSSYNPKHRRVRVLIVDDTPQVRRDLRQFLDLTGGMEVIAEAADGQEAVRLANELTPDVIVMDLEMPRMDGFEATRQIKERGPAPRIIILSVHADPENIARARSAGADEFVVKGASFKVLINAILTRNGSFDSIDPKKGT
jgi:DNA-binding NarL/FixJ family response regulator